MRITREGGAGAREAAAVDRAGVIASAALAPCASSALTARASGAPVPLAVVVLVLVAPWCPCGSWHVVSPPCESQVRPSAQSSSPSQGSSIAAAASVQAPAESAATVRAKQAAASDLVSIVMKPWCSPTRLVGK